MSIQQAIRLLLETNEKMKLYLYVKLCCSGYDINK